MGRLLREVCGIVALFAALIALLALVTFEQSDPGWSHTGSSESVHNRVGWAGAWFADVALYLFGFMAYLVPLLLACSGWALFRSARQRVPAYRPFVFIRLIGVALMFLTASGLADLHVGVSGGALPEGTFGGGILGTITAWRLVAFLHPLGTTLLLLGLFFCSLTLAFGTSWIQLIEWLGGGVLRTVEWLTDQYSATADARRERELRRRELYVDESDQAFDDDRDSNPRIGFPAQLPVESTQSGKSGKSSKAVKAVKAVRALRAVDDAAGSGSSAQTDQGEASVDAGKNGQGGQNAGNGRMRKSSTANDSIETSGRSSRIDGARKSAARWLGSRNRGDEADPLLDAFPDDLPGGKPKVGLAAALDLARNTARKGGSTSADEPHEPRPRETGPVVDGDGTIPLGNRVGGSSKGGPKVIGSNAGGAGAGGSSERFDAMADALDRSMTLDSSSEADREPGNRAVLKAARALKIAQRADRAEPISSDFDPLAAASMLPPPSSLEEGPMSGSGASSGSDSGTGSGSSENAGRIASGHQNRIPAAAPAPVAAEEAGTGSAPKIKPRAPEQAQAKLFLDVPDSDLPPLSLLDAPEPQRAGFSRDELEALSRLLEEKLAEFRIEVEVVAVHPGPVITSFEMQPAPGIKASRITGLAQDIARSMSLPSVRVVEVIPGKSTIGIEVPNDHREIVQLSEMLLSEAYARQKSPLTLALGKDISGNAVTADLARMPHLLVAGTTGSGKSVAVNAMLISLLYKATAKDVRLILIDPKMLELNVYDDIPHLLSPVVTDMGEAANALRWCVGEMERRYTIMAALKVRNLAGYNKKVNDAKTNGIPLTDPLWQAELSLDPTGPPPVLEPMPMIVVVVDEFADMMMQVGKKAEELITRIAQKARAAGIHLILATQRPSVDVITGLIKANVPSRIAFQVSQKVDSRTIIDQGGAESLLGHGDMLYLPPGTGVPVRVHGAFVDDHEVHNVVSHIKQTGPPNYIEEILHESTASIPGLSGSGEESDAETDALYDQAVAVVLESRKASISYVQRRLKIGYNRAARMIEDMENAGVVSTVTGNGTREVLAPPPGG